MTTWLIRIKHNFELAEQHSIVMIGFGIDRDITGMRTLQEIKDYLKSRGESGQGLNIRAGLIHKFINEVNIGDTIISQFQDGSLHRGKITSDCKKVEAWFPGSPQALKKILGNRQPPEEIKPARKVEWQEKISLSKFTTISPLKPNPSVLQRTIHFLPEE